MFQRLALLLLLSSLLVLGACDSRREQEPAPAGPPPTKVAAAADQAPANDAATEPSAATKGASPVPPSPPIREDFEGAPRLSLFARVGAFRPEDDDRRGQAFWRTYIDHAQRTSGPVAGVGRGGGRAWAIRSIKGLDSVGFFSPIAVQPKTTYRVQFAFKGPLPEGASAGVGILEFDQFLWIGDQFSASQSREHRTGTDSGLRLGEGGDWQEHSFTFTTAAATHMIHLVLFRDGPSAKKPVLFDDLSIIPVPAG